jgi:GTP:adenosylcobinamide-phosphate guanylyltransferase
MAVCEHLAGRGVFDGKPEENSQGIAGWNEGYVTDTSAVPVRSSPPTHILYVGKDIILQTCEVIRSVFHMAGGFGVSYRGLCKW